MHIEAIDDLDLAKQVALLLEQENARLLSRIEALTKELHALKGDERAQLEIELMKVREYHAQLEQRLFGRSSEKRGSDANASDDKNKKPHRGHGARPQTNLEERTEAHGFTEALGECKVCGDPVELWEGHHEDTEEITVLQRQFIRVKHRRHKARCSCYATIKTAPGPLRLIPGGRYSVAFAVHVAVAKYLDHLPLHRQAQMMLREGLIMDSQTLWDQIAALATLVTPTYDALRAYVVAKPLLHADETPWFLLAKKPVGKHFVWCVGAEDAAYYWIRGGRGAKHGGEVLDAYEGVVMADGYRAYETLASANQRIKLANCWAHVRRKFCEAEQHYPEQCKTMLDLIRALYAIEKSAPNPLGLSGLARDEALQVRGRLRTRASAPVIALIKHTAMTMHSPQGTALRGAIDYMLKLWPGLTVFLDDPLVPLDNNFAERQLRGPVVGRKNHYGSRSVRGTEVTAILYTLLQTAKLVRVEPHEYLSYVAALSLRDPGTSVFPHELVAEAQTATAAA